MLPYGTSSVEIGFFPKHTMNSRGKFGGAFHMIIRNFSGLPLSLLEAVPALLSISNRQDTEQSQTKE
jgi:hypothetical protein